MSAKAGTIRGMTDISLLFRAHHGCMSAKQLSHYGINRTQLRAAIASGGLTLVRRGWYRHATVEVPAQVLAAVAAGGVLTGASALALHGAWNLHGPIDVRGSRIDRIKSAPGLRAIALQRDAARPCTSAVDPIRIAFRAALLTLTDEQIIIVGDSIVDRDLLTRADLLAIAQDLSAPKRATVARIHGVCESGTETKVRLWLEGQRIRHRAQAKIYGVGRVDFLVGRRLIIEVDSREHHTEKKNHQGDRTRDLEFVALGYLVIRVTYADVMYGWDRVASRILRVIRRGEHRLEPIAQRRG